MGGNRVVLRPAGRHHLPPGLPHTDPMYYLQQAADLGQRLHHRPNDAAER